MSSRATLIKIIILVLVLIGIGAFVLIAKNNSTSQLDPDPTSTPSASATASIEDVDTTLVPNSSATQISMLSDGFLPSSIAIKKNTELCFLNKDSIPHWPASNNHPSHLLYPEFDPKLPVVAGNKWCFIFTKTGNWGFHDHLSPRFQGTVTVSE